MSQGPAPIALTCGEPAGVGVEIAAKLWHRRAECPPFFLIGDPRHLPAGTPHRVIAHPTEAAAALPHGLPVLDHPFDGARVPGLPQPAHAAQPDEAKNLICHAAISRAMTRAGAPSDPVMESAPKMNSTRLPASGRGPRKCSQIRTPSRNRR